MKINLAHLRQRAVSGGWVDFVVFDARSNSGSNSDNAKLLANLTARARMSGLKVDQSALAFMQNGTLTFYGTRTLVDFLSKDGAYIQWTHQIDVD